MYVTTQVKKKLVLRPHSFTASIKRTGIYYCCRCGLVPLNNEATHKLIRKGCFYNENAKD